jgi:hypothetical protein
LFSFVAGNFVALRGDVPAFLLNFWSVMIPAGRPVQLLLPIAV